MKLGTQPHAKLVVGKPKTVPKSGGARAEELDNTSGADELRGLDVTSGGDGTRKLGGNIEGG